MTRTAALVLGAASNGKALWYLTRATGIVALLLLTATVVIGVVASVGWASVHWPRFLSQAVHRNLSLLCVAFVGVHVATTVGDGYVPIDLADAFVPFASPYRPVWIGLGAVGLDLLVALLLTSALRSRIGYRSWRLVHWTAYVCWPVAVFHAAGSGSDAALPLVLSIDALCVTAVLVALGWRLIAARRLAVRSRVALGGASLIVVLALALFVAVGPMRPGWSRRAGTSPALLAELARRAGSTGGAATSAPPTTSPVPDPPGTPKAPFAYDVSGSQTIAPSGSGDIQVTIALRLANSASTPLVVTLVGTPLGGGGVALTTGSVDFGDLRGTVSGLQGSTIDASLPPPESESLTITLTESGSGNFSGSVTAIPSPIAGGVRG